ncbi:MAG: hypothetical protein KUG70_09055, partial [Rhodobacteraceae bacterium]|nr:hypothetical protein [Paracoccaceae bacterium]
LGTKYLNQMFSITREVRDDAGVVTTSADYSQLGVLLIIVTAITVVLPLVTIFLVQNSRLRTSE